MADNFKLPSLPSGWSYGYADDPSAAPSADPTDEAQKGVGSVLREIAGPQKPIEQPTFLNDFLKPTAEKIADVAIPHDPVGIGLLLASTVLTGGSAPAVRIMGKIGGELLPVAESMGSSAIKRMVGMGAAGAAAAGLSGESPLSGAFQGLMTQIGGEGITKLTQWTRMNAQARQLAAEDPERLGEIVSNIIPSIGSMRSPKDFHAAFKKGAAQSAISKAYTDGMSDVSQKMSGQLIPSQVMMDLRGNPARSVQSGVLSGAGQGMPASQFLGGGGQPGKYTVDDMAETIRRLRYQGWNGDEVARGLNARDARMASDELQKELVSQLPPDVAEQFLKTNESYSRGRRVIDFFDDKNLFKQDGALNVPALQKKIKADGYSVRDSYQMAADAADLEAGLFRGATDLGEDIPGKPGQLLPRIHLGGSATLLPHLPQVGKFAGREPAGATPFQGSLGGQLIRNYLNPPVHAAPERPISLRRDDEPSEQ